MNVKVISITSNQEAIKSRIMALLQEYSDNLDNTNEFHLQEEFKTAMDNIFLNNNIITYIAEFARVCTNRDDKNNNIENDYNTCIRLWKNKHLTPFESINIDFLIEGVSRALLGQITRYRHCSFNVESQRYCNYKDKDLEFIMPDSIMKIGLTEIVDNIYKCNLDDYSNLIDKGIKPEDARFVLPMATPTRLRVVCNLREFLHIFRERSSNHAQQEIRDLMFHMSLEFLNALDKRSQDLVAFMLDSMKHNINQMLKDLNEHPEMTSEIITEYQKYNS